MRTTLRYFEASSGNALENDAKAVECAFWRNPA